MYGIGTCMTQQNLSDKKQNYLTWLVLIIKIPPSVHKALTGFYMGRIVLVLVIHIIMFNCDVQKGNKLSAIAKVIFIQLS